MSLEIFERERAVNGESFLSTVKQAEIYADKYEVPIGDVLYIALNLSGIQHKDVVNDRGRFELTLPGGKSHRVALTITNSPATKFSHNGANVYLGSEKIGDGTAIEKDTCTDSYWRSETHLTLNSNSRSACKGCHFCGTYSLERADDPLTDEKHLTERAIELAKEAGGSFSHVDAIGIVTGCFPNEQPIVDHVKSVRKVFSQLGFKGEIQYIGSQLKSEDAISQLIEDGPFALYLTTEIFSRRDQLMKKQKSSLTLGGGRQILQTTKKLGGQSSFLYIAGLDSLETIYEELPKFAEVVTRFPQLQTYQLYTPEQEKYRSDDAHTLDYYLKLRQFAEQQFPDLKPVTFHNYRGLWYSQYQGKPL